MNTLPVIFINSHPIQYFAPMYKFMNEHGVATQAWYCSDESIKGLHDAEFGIKVKWDIPLLEGYKYRFFKNYSWKPSHANGFFGLINLGIIRALFKEPKSIIVVHGWHYFSNFFVLMLGKLAGHTICLRNDMPQKQEELKQGWKQKVKYTGLKYALFPRINYFLYIGNQNRLLYKSYSLPDKRLVFCPYAVDNGRFQLEYEKYKHSIPALKQSFGIPADDKVIIFSAKFVEKKKPLDLLKAFHQLNKPESWLIFVGEGNLRPEMERYIQTNGLKNVILTGFVNQSEISRYYAICDVFVMCSGMGENWGLSVNEAMNFNVPLILSDLTGCADDLVIEGNNGYVFKTGDVNELTLRLKQVLYDKELLWTMPSEQVVDNYSFLAVTNHIKEDIA